MRVCSSFTRHLALSPAAWSMVITSFVIGQVPQTNLSEYKFLLSSQRDILYVSKFVCLNLYVKTLINYKFNCFCGFVCVLGLTAQKSDLPSLLVYPVDYWFFLTPYTGLLGGRTFILVLKKIHFWYLTFFSDFYLFFVCIQYSLSDNGLAATYN